MRNVKGATEKLCRDCKQMLPIGDFHADRKNLDSAGSYCKKCNNKRCKEFVKKQKELRKEEKV